MLALLTAVILGVVEGLTEFLPVSSTGHLILAERALNFHDNQELFTVVIQVGAIAAVLWYFREDLYQKILGLFRGDETALKFWKVLIIATIPAGVIGLALDKVMSVLTVPVVVAVALIIGGIVLWAVDRAPKVASSDKKAIEHKIEQVTFKQALIVGFSQCVAMIPGVSRSGATIVGGLGAGLDRPTATAFSFYLSIPVLVMASAYKLVKHGDALATIPGGVGALLIGMLFAFLTALAAVSWLLHYVSHNNFRPFAYYRIALGIAILVWLAIA